jgi:hypothetical protein
MAGAHPSTGSTCLRAGWRGPKVGAATQIPARCGKLDKVALCSRLLFNGEQALLSPTTGDRHGPAIQP